MWQWVGVDNELNKKQKEKRQMIQLKQQQIHTLVLCKFTTYILM